MIGEQMRIDLGDLDTWCGKTSLERCPVIKEKTSVSSLKKSQGSQTKAFLFLNLMGGGGAKPDVSWETDGALHGVYMTRSFGEYPKEDVVSHLSEILTDRPHPKYYLSARGCDGVIDRAERRQKDNFPDELREALEEQSAYLKEHPEAIRLATEWYEAHKDEYVDDRGTIEAKGIDANNKCLTGYKSATLRAQNDFDHGGVVLLGHYLHRHIRSVDGIGQEPTERRDHSPKEDDSVPISFIPRQGAKAQSVGATKDKSNTLNALRETAVVEPIALDRSAYNQGKNAQYEIGIDTNGTAFTLTAKGCGLVQE